MSSELIDALLWCVTYLVHSTLAVLCVLLLERRGGARVRDVLWKVALVLPFATATFQADLHRRVPSLDLAPKIDVEVVPEHGAPQKSPFAIALQTERGVEDPLGSQVSRVDRATGLTIRPATPSEPALGSESKIWLGTVLGLLVLWLLPAARIAIALRGRRRLTSGRLHEDLHDLRSQTRFARPVRLSVSERVDSPIAFGLLRPEICLPPRTAHLSPGLARAVLAHELAHHARFDLFWCRLAWTIRWAFAFQPMLILVQNRIAASGELLADDLAVHWTRDGAGLARSLAAVAQWQAQSVGRGAAIAMVDVKRRNGALLRRVERALAPARERGGRWAIPIGIALAVSAAAAAPRIERLERYDSVAGPYGAVLDRIHADLVAVERRVDDTPNTDHAERERIEIARRKLLTLARVARSRALHFTGQNQ